MYALVQGSPFKSERFQNFEKITLIALIRHFNALNSKYQCFYGLVLEEKKKKKKTVPKDQTSLHFRHFSSFLSKRVECNMMLECSNEAPWPWCTLGLFNVKFRKKRVRTEENIGKKEWIRQIVHIFPPNNTTQNLGLFWGITTSIQTFI